MKSKTQKVRKQLDPKKIQVLLRLYNEKKYSYLNAEIFKLLKKFPNDYLLNNIGGLVSVQLQLNDQAFKFFKRAISNNPMASEPHVNMGYLLLNNDNPDEALRAFNLAEELSEENIEAKIGKSLALNKIGQLQKAVDILVDAGKRAPGNPRIFYSLGNIYQTLGHFDEARVAFERSLKLEPNFFAAANNLGLLFFEKDDFHAAAHNFKLATTIDPKSAAAHCNLGNALAKLDAKKSIEAYRTSISLEPNNSGVHVNLISMLVEHNKIIDVFNAFKEALKKNPSDDVILNTLIEFLYQRDKFSAIINLSKKALENTRKPALLYNNIGRALIKKGNATEALDHFQKAIEYDGNMAQAHANLGFILQTQGKIPLAEKAFRREIIAKPDYALAHRMAVNLQDGRIDNEWIRKMLNILRSKKLSIDDQCQICFAIAVSYEKNSEFKMATKYFSKANNCRAMLLNYNHNKEMEKFTATKRHAAKLKSIKFQPKNKAKAYVIPIFIVGMPRSGTTLIESIVSAHPSVSPGGELDYLFRSAGRLDFREDTVSFLRLQKIRDDYLNQLRKIDPHSQYITDKLPHNFMNIGLISKILPEAKIIDVTRSPAAVCWSNYTTYLTGSSHGYSCDLSDLIEYHKSYENLMNFWRQNWSKQIFSLDYECLVKNPEENIRKLISFLGIEWANQCLRPELNEREIFTASYRQARRPIYGGSSEKWRKFIPYLDGKFDQFL